MPELLLIFRQAGMLSDGVVVRSHFESFDAILMRGDAYELLFRVLLQNVLD